AAVAAQRRLLPPSDGGRAPGHRGGTVRRVPRRPPCPLAGHNLKLSLSCAPFRGGPSPRRGRQVPSRAGRCVRVNCLHRARAGEPTMILHAVLLWADDAAQPSLLNPMTIMLGLFFLFFFIVLLPAQRRQERERLAMLAAVEKNDRVLTTGGIYGTIVSISDKEDELLVKVDDNVKLRMSRGSIARNLTKEEKARQAKDEKAAGK